MASPRNVTESHNIKRIYVLSDDMTICKVYPICLLLLLTGPLETGCVDLRKSHKPENVSVSLIFLGNGSGIPISVSRDFPILQKKTNIFLKL